MIKNRDVRQSGKSNYTMESPIFTSLGMFIIDENEYPSSWNRPSEYNIIGGAGSYSIVGARIIAGKKYGHLITGVIDRGYDFPQEVQQELDSWGTGILFRTDNSRMTTRGKNTYDENNIRHFDYLSDKKRIEIEDLEQNQWLLKSKCFHLICSIERCYQLVLDIKKYNKEAIFIYEPLPSDCVAANYQKLIDLLPLIDIFTPNLNEGCQLLNIKEPSDIAGMKSITESYVDLGASHCVLRCGAVGCFVASESQSLHLPSYHQDQTKVLDVTGGGNSFCGGFMIGFYMTNDICIGGICGNISSGCVIERLGMPLRDDEKWNGLSTKERIKTYLRNNKEIDVDMRKFHWIES